MEAAFYQISMMKGVRILHSDSDENSAQILFSLAAEEANKGNQIAIDEKYIAEHSQVYFST
jgi:ERCC4-type nuclease